MTVDQIPSAKSESATNTIAEPRTEAGAFWKMPKNVTGLWPVLVFALIAFGAGLATMAALSGAVAVGSITARSQQYWA